MPAFRRSSTFRCAFLPDKRVDKSPFAFEAIGGPGGLVCLLGSMSANMVKSPTLGGWSGESKPMDKKSVLEQDLKNALRARDDVRKRTIRMAWAAIKLAEVERHGALDDNAILGLLQKEVKTRNETIADAEKASRPDLVDSAKAELEVLEGYLPQPITGDELEALARQAIAESGATSVKEVGQVMKLLMPRLRGRADGKAASEKVRGLLATD